MTGPATPATFDPLEQGFVAWPYDQYQRLRAEDGLALGHGRRGAGLRDSNLDARHVAASRLEHYRERRLQAEKAWWRGQGLHPRHRLAPAEIRDGADHGEEQDQEDEHPGFRARPLGHEADDTMRHAPTTRPHVGRALRATRCRPTRCRP